MRFLMTAVAALALVAPVGLSAQAPANAPACRADLDGNRLTTTIEFSDGYAVEAPWTVNWNRSASLEDGSRGVAADASLDRIVEVDPQTGQRMVTPFPEPIETTFEGRSEEELIYRAAQIWCLTVLRAQEQNSGGAHRPTSSPRRSSVGAAG
ncbi:MAG TPA: hypothetical protein VF212_15740 [Longimicrobiales bacterium]